MNTLNLTTLTNELNQNEDFFFLDFFFNEKNNVIYVKNDAGNFGFAISKCLNKNLNKDFLYVNLVKFEKNNDYTKLIAVGTPSGDLTSLIKNLFNVFNDFSFVK